MDEGSCRISVLRARLRAHNALHGCFDGVVFGEEEIVSANSGTTQPKQKCPQNGIAVLVRYTVRPNEMLEASDLLESQTLHLTMACSRHAGLATFSCYELVRLS